MQSFISFPHAVLFYVCKRSRRAFFSTFLLLLEGNVSGCKDQETPNGGFEQRFEERLNKNRTENFDWETNS
jgi:hypothetical protein